MAVVPSGWAYWDKSANKRIVAGGTIPTPAEGDEYFGVTSSGATDYSKLLYKYYNSETRNYINQNSNVQQTTFTLPAGWHVVNQNYTMTSATVASSIGGKNVVAVKIHTNTVSKISSLSLPSTVVMVWLNDNSNLTTITGSLGSALKEFFCYRSPKLKSVSTLANATNLTNCNYIFKQCTALTTIPTLPPNAVSLYCAFQSCTSLTSVPTIPSTVKDMAYLCEGCTTLTAAPSNNSTVILYMHRAFADCTNLTNASNFSTPNTVEAGWELFRNCSKLTQIPTVISGTNANYNGIFRGCTLLNVVPTFSGSITQLVNAFRECVSLITPPIIKNILNCEMNHMFYGCTSLTTIPELPNSMLSAYYMFYNCTSLTWASVIIPAHSNPPSINCMFAGCSNLTGVIWIKGTYSNAHVNTFTDTVQPIILSGDINTTGPLLAATANNNNVYMGLNATVVENGIARCDATGTLDDEGGYAKLTIKFKCPYLPNSKIYVPKVYIKNAQQQPIQNWTLTYVNNSDETIVKTITNSTDIIQDHIEANDLITNGTFETIFNAVDDSVYTIYIPTSCSQVAQDYDTNGNYVISTYYWNGTSGQAIFTGDTYIFDALPDGSCFKIGGPIIENNGDTGFIVGNEVSLLSAQYPSTFNGPVNFNSIVRIKNIELLNFLYPVGSYYETSDASFDPNVAWGGTWSLEASGLVHVSAGTGYTLGSTGGNKDAIVPYHRHSYNAPPSKTDSTTLTTSQIPAHTHGSKTLVGNANFRKWTTGKMLTYTDGIFSSTEPTTSATSVESSGTNPNKVDRLTVTATHEHTSVGGGGGHTHNITASSTNTGYAGESGNLTNANMQPYVVVNRWHRTA